LISLLPYITSMPCSPSYMMRKRRLQSMLRIASRVVHLLTLFS